MDPEMIRNGIKVLMEAHSIHHTHNSQHSPENLGQPWSMAWTHRLVKNTFKGVILVADSHKKQSFTMKRSSESLDLYDSSFGDRNNNRSTAPQRRIASQKHGRRLARKRLLQDVDDDERSYSKLIYRSTYDDAYKICAFLDPYDILVASQGSLTSLDIIRMSKSPEEKEDSEQDCELQGHPLALGVSVQPLAPISKVFSLKGGKAFLVGLDSGEFRIFETEGCGEHALGSTSYPLCKASVSQKDMNRQQPFVKSAWRGRRALRRYARGDIEALCRDPDLLGGVEEIQSWSNPDISWTTYDSLSWDVRETASTCLIANVGHGRDYLCLRILDDRTPDRGNQLLVDSSLTPGGKLQSCCFLSDWIISANGQEAHLDPHFKLWDIRFLKDSSPAAACLVPSFPRDTVYTTSIMKSTSVRSRPDCLYSLEGSLMLSVSFSIRTKSTIQVLDCTGESIVSLSETPYNLNGGFKAMAFNRRFSVLASHRCENTIEIFDFSTTSKPTRTQIQSKVSDRFGVESAVCSLALNDDGTCLVGGTLDGDLHVLTGAC